MNRNYSRCVLPVVVALAMSLWSTNFVGLASAQSPSIPTVDDLRQMYAAQGYHPCLQMISKLLFLKGQAAANVDRPKLLLLKGDCMVKLKDSRAAMTAYKQAKDAAGTTDPATALSARAAILILQNCRGLTYMPQGVPPIDVTTDEGWKEAAQAIYNQKWAGSQASLSAAESAQDLAPIFSVVPTITDLVALNHVTGADPGELVPMLRSIGQRARDIIMRELANQDATTGAVERNADVVLSVNVGPGYWGNSWSPTVRQGLSTPDRDQLDQVIDIASEAYDVAAQGKQAAILVGGDQAKWQMVMDEAAHVRDHAQRVLDAE